MNRRSLIMATTLSSSSTSSSPINKKMSKLRNGSWSSSSSSSNNSSLDINNMISNGSGVNQEEEEEDNQPGGSTSSDQIIQSLTSKYAEIGDKDMLGKTLAHLRENIKAGICLICIEDVGRHEAVWSCQTCYCILHLVCIQRWARDSIENVKEKARERGWNLPVIFCCPKCRKEYSEQEFPDKYRCFCGKLTNPRSDPWNAPHSCGETCEKPLKPECGHNCLLLCHSGPCPPCPKQVTSTCFCGQSSPKTMRCYSKTWGCGNPCSKPLPCGIHKCSLVCHTPEGEEDGCPPCLVPRTLECNCSSPEQLIVPCNHLRDPGFSLSCGKVCGKILSCGVHRCKDPCHEGECGVCEQTCPCGKSRALCRGADNEEGSSAAGKPCGETCEKVLDCGSHYCGQRCHLGTCGSCLVNVVKKCKCGQYEKEILCSKEFICTTKCKKLRDCKIHPCNKKCCPGDCPPCRNVCGKTLACKNHKCESICHSGPCYPCPVTAQAKCRCGKTVRQVPCGSERKCKPPECSEPCGRPPKCDHSKIQNHRCHFGDCPRCRLPCGKTLPCKHQCQTTCHTLKKSTGSGKGHGHSSKPCPKCTRQVNSKCPLHQGVLVPCHLVDQRCTEICRRVLACGEHSCSKPCHLDVSLDCGECREPCGKPRPSGCTHQCELGCHQGPCQPCTLVAKVPCHCGSEEMLVPCFKQPRLTEGDRSCKNQCPKKLLCTHRCLSLCHSGPCPELDKCRRKVKLSCKCKHVKKDVECFIIQDELGGNKVLECQVGVCSIPKPKTPKDSIENTKEVRKRTRKKKISEGTEGPNKEEEQVVPIPENEEPGVPEPNVNQPSRFTSNLKAIGIIALSAFVTAVILKQWGSLIISDDYRHHP